MKILLVGEFSRLHGSLKEGLIALGHEVVLIGKSDLFKKYPVDINIDSTYFNGFIFLKIRKLIHALFNFDLADLEVGYRFNKAISKLHDFDVIQLINEDALAVHPKIQIPLLRKLIAKNSKLFLLCCGDDYITIKYYLKPHLRYSILTPYLNDSSLKRDYKYSLKYLTKNYKKLHDFIYSNSCGTIASDIDYHLPLLNHSAYLGLIPNPININKIGYLPLNTDNKIIIFHGINTLSFTKKGGVFFSEALEIISKRYPEKVTIIKTKNLPYNEYIKVYNKAHIVLDQVYAYDQGYNALEAMAKGKVVFTGAEQEWLDYYNLEEDTVAINALPDANKIAEKLEWLILNPEKIQEISKSARAFIEKEHNYITVAEKYIATWQLHSKN